MTSDASEPGAPRPAAISYWLWVSAAGIVLAVVVVLGVRGCGSEDPQAAAERAEEQKKKAEEERKKQQDPKLERLVVEPGDSETTLQFVKPGHWVTSVQRMGAVYEDFIGDLRTTMINSQGQVYPIEHTPFTPQSTRPVALTKGRPKDVETTFLVPQVNQAMQVRMELMERGFGRSLRFPMPVTRMPAYQYHFVILAKEPGRYALVKSLDSVKVPFDGESDADDTEDTVHYRVTALDVERGIQLPDNPLTWTSIAYVLWDEVDPQLFTPEQEQALVDWLHWGGQLVVNGPDSLDLLKGSFLESYLPATSGGSRTIATSDPALAELNRYWMIPRGRGGGERLAPTAAWSGVKLDVHPDAKEMESTGGLLVERPIGNGRIVVSAMQLTERDLVNWRSGFESLFNACVLRRPNRIYRPGYFGDTTLIWADPNLKDHRLDARLTTGLRYLARDLGIDTNYQYVEVADDANAQYYRWMPDIEPEPIRVHRPPDRVGGIGAWNDFSLTANAGREALLQAAGVEVPDTSFVVLSLATYLIVLVPLNWMVFHAVGRIEWAWIAAPLIAVVGTWIVVKQAQLDIGFVRSQTEIGVLELQPEYPRGHLTRYTALYTSLSTTYDLEFDNLTAVAAPFPTRENPQNLQNLGRSVCDYQRYDASRLGGVLVNSNSTNMVHSEQMFPLDGTIRLGKSTTQGRAQIENRSQLHLKSVAVVRRPLPGAEARRGVVLEGVWIGALRPSESSSVAFPVVPISEDKPAFANERAAEERLQHTPRLNLEPTFRLALDPQLMEPGETRLVARVDEVLPGETITPAASQVRGATLVVAHLAYAPREKPRPDVNTRRGVPRE